MPFEWTQILLSPHWFHPGDTPIAANAPQLFLSALSLCRLLWLLALATPLLSIAFARRPEQLLVTLGVHAHLFPVPIRERRRTPRPPGHRGSRTWPGRRHRGHARRPHRRYRPHRGSRLRHAVRPTPSDTRRPAGAVPAYAAKRQHRFVGIRRNSCIRMCLQCSLFTDFVRHCARRRRRAAHPTRLRSHHPVV